MFLEYGSQPASLSTFGLQPRPRRGGMNRQMDSQQLKLKDRFAALIPIDAMPI